MRSVALIAMLLALPGAGSIAAQRKGRAAVPPAGELTISFAGRGALGAGVLDLGTVSHAGRDVRKDRTVRRDSVAIVVKRSNGVRGSVVLSAWLSAPDPHCVIRVDGVVLSSVPAIIDPQLAVGTESIHRIEIEVPVSAPEGPLAGAIQWEATTR
jgi:transglutaminase-like putative cysteine protease